MDGIKCKIIICEIYILTYQMESYVHLIHFKYNTSCPLKKQKSYHDASFVSQKCIDKNSSTWCTQIEKKLASWEGEFRKV